MSKSKIRYAQLSDFILFLFLKGMLVKIYAQMAQYLTNVLQF